MATTAPPAAATTVQTATLEKAMADASIQSSPASSEPKELPASEGSELEDGEIRDSGNNSEAEEDDGRVKTVFDDAKKFNVKHPLYSTWTLHYDSPQNKPKAAAGAGWGNDMRKVVTINSVEEFWGTYNNIVPPSQLPLKANYYLFKDGIAPAWEDEQNKNGGKWEIQVAREKSKSIIDKMWLYTMLAAIGETFETPLAAEGEKSAAPEKSDLVTGVLVAARQNLLVTSIYPSSDGPLGCLPGPTFGDTKLTPSYRVVIWTREAPDVTLPETDPLMKRIMLIGRHFKVDVLGFKIDDVVCGPQPSALASEVNFESHQDSTVRGNKKKIVI